VFEPLVQQQQPVFEPPVQQQPLFLTPTSDDYYTGDTPPLGFLLANLLGGTADEIGGTQLSGAPPVTQPTQEQQHAMMEDFHGSAQRASEALEAAASMEAEARARRLHRHRSERGSARRAPRLRRQPPEAGHIGLSDSTRHPPEGLCPVGLKCSLSDTAPRADDHRTRSPSTRPPHVPDPPHEGCTEGGGSGEEEGAPGPPTTDETRSYLDLYLDTCRVQYLCLFVFSCLLFRIYSIEKNEKEKGQKWKIKPTAG
jgi:hypothetical protein